LVAFRWNDDWSSRIEDFIDAHAAESAMMAMIYRELFFGKAFCWSIFIFKQTNQNTKSLRPIAPVPFANMIILSENQHPQLTNTILTN
jgi:hypothetical protein